jgi:hypothetical protein
MSLQPLRIVRRHLHSHLVDQIQSGEKGRKRLFFIMNDLNPLLTVWAQTCKVLLLRPPMYTLNLFFEDAHFSQTFSVSLVRLPRNNHFHSFFLRVGIDL